MTTVIRHKGSGPLNYYCKTNGKRIALHENKATAQQLALAHAAKAHREKHGIEAPPATEKEPWALQVIAEYLRTRDRFAPNSINIIATNKLLLSGEGLHRKG